MKRYFKEDQSLIYGNRIINYNDYHINTKGQGILDVQYKIEGILDRGHKAVITWNDSTGGAGHNEFKSVQDWKDFIKAKNNSDISITDVWITELKENRAKRKSIRENKYKDILEDIADDLRTISVNFNDDRDDNLEIAANKIEAGDVEEGFDIANLVAENASDDNDDEYAEAIWDAIAPLRQLSESKRNYKKSFVETENMLTWEDISEGYESKEFVDLFNKANIFLKSRITKENFSEEDFDDLWRAANPKYGVARSIHSNLLYLGDGQLKINCDSNLYGDYYIVASNDVKWATYIIIDLVEGTVLLHEGWYPQAATADHHTPEETYLVGEENKLKEDFEFYKLPGGKITVDKVFTTTERSGKSFNDGTANGGDTSKVTKRKSLSQMSQDEKKLVNVAYNAINAFGAKNKVVNKFKTSPKADVVIKGDGKTADVYFDDNKTGKPDIKDIDLTDGKYTNKKLVASKKINRSRISEKKTEIVPALYDPKYLRTDIGEALSYFGTEEDSYFSRVPSKFGVVYGDNEVNIGLFDKYSDDISIKIEEKEYFDKKSNAMKFGNYVTILGYPDFYYESYGRKELVDDLIDCVRQMLKNHKD